jgi:hypothetical protein
VSAFPRLDRLTAALAGLAIASAVASSGGADAAVTKPGPLPAARISYVSFLNSPFPYRGIIPDKGIPFLDASTLAQRGHTAPRAGGVVYWEKPTYSDRRSLIYFPKGFDIRKPALIVVFFHGNEVILQRDVVGRQQVPAQVSASGLNAVLLAPQMALDALDSSAGNFWTAGGFGRYLDEAAANIASVYGDPAARTTFAKLPVVFVAYSGGYDPAAYALRYGGVAKRIKGVILLDSPYDDEEKFADFIAQNRTAFLFSGYGGAAAENNARLKAMLSARRVPFAVGAPDRLAPGVVAFVAADPELTHTNFVTDAWVPDPVAWSLARIPGYAR